MRGNLQSYQVTLFTRAKYAGEVEATSTEDAKNRAFDIWIKSGAVEFEKDDDELCDVFVTDAEPIRYEVQHHTVCDGWTNTWSVDDEPQTFATRAEAQAEIDEFLRDIEAESQAGERQADNGYTADEFRVEVVQRPPPEAPPDDDADKGAGKVTHVMFEAYLRKEGGYYYWANKTVHFDEKLGFWCNYKGEESPLYKTYKGLMKYQYWLSLPDELPPLDNSPKVETSP